MFLEQRCVNPRCIEINLSEINYESNEDVFVVLHKIVPQTDVHVTIFTYREGYFSQQKRKGFRYGVKKSERCGKVYVRGTRDREIGECGRET